MGSPRSWAWLGAAALAWATLSWRLYRDGVVARAVLLPVEPSSYYAVQAVLVGPLLLLLAALFAAVAHRLTVQSYGPPLRVTFDALAPVYAGSLLVCYLLPDWAAYLHGGRQGMAAAMRYYAPLTPLLIVLGSASRLSLLHGVSQGRAVVAALAGLVVQALVGAPLLR